MLSSSKLTHSLSSRAYSLSSRVHSLSSRAHSLSSRTPPFVIPALDAGTQDLYGSPLSRGRQVEGRGRQGKEHQNGREPRIYMAPRIREDDREKSEDDKEENESDSRRGARMVEEAREW